MQLHHYKVVSCRIIVQMQKLLLVDVPLYCL